MEPVLCPLRGSQSAAIVNIPQSRGDILLALQDALTVVDISVVHPAAATYGNAAICTEGSAAAVRYHTKSAQYENSDPFGYAYVPLSTKTFGRLGKPGMALMKKFIDCASAGGVVFKEDLLSMLCVNSLSGCVGQMCAVQAQSVCSSSCKRQCFPCRC